MPCVRSNQDFLDCYEELSGGDSSGCCSHGTFAGAGGHPFDGPDVVDHFAPDLVIQPTHIHAELDFTAMAERCLRGKATLTFQRSSTVAAAPSTTSADTLLDRMASEVTLNAVAFSRVELDDAAWEGKHTYDGERIHLRWSHAFAPGEQRTVTILYEVREPVSGLFFVLPSKRRPAHLAKGMHCITDHETERCRYWLPCVDFPAVRTTLQFDITAAAHMVSLATGKKLGETVSSDGKTKCTSWRLDQHVCPSYLICLAVGEYERVEDTSGPIPLEYFAPKGYPAEDIRRAFEKTPAMIRWMEKKLGNKFPWPKYFQVASSDIRGAMENISLVTWSEKYLMDKTWELERRLYMDIVNVHEMAHTYFGDLVVIRHFEQVWMKESWATYMESVWVQDHMTQDDFRFEMLENAESYMSETEIYLRPLVHRSYESSWSLFDAHTYPGGCWRIHMLRCVLGDSVFWSAVQKYIARYQGKTVETEDFRKILEAESGLNLTRFFQEWYYSCGYPKLKAQMNFKKDEKKVEITVEQTQMDKTKNVPLFHFLLDAVVVDEKGKEYRGVVNFMHGDSPKATVNFSVEDAPASVRLDPEGKVLFSLEFNHGETTLANVARSGGDILSRIRAYHELIKIGSPTAMKKVHEGILEESFYGVRVKGMRPGELCVNRDHTHTLIVAAKLSEVRSIAAIRTLVALLDKETHPMAMWRIAKACNIRDPQVRNAILRALKSKPVTELPYRYQEFLLDNLGLQANPEDLALLLQIAKDDSRRGYHDFVRAGVYRGLGNHRSKESFDFLLAIARDKYSETVNAYAAAIDALGRSLLWQENFAVRQREVVELLNGLVARDEFEPVRKTAIVALVQIGAKMSAEVVSASKPLYARQDWQWVEEKAQKLRAATGGNGASAVGELTKRVEELEGKLRKVEEKVAVVEAEKKSNQEGEKQ